LAWKESIEKSAPRIRYQLAEHHPHFSDVSTDVYGALLLLKSLGAARQTLSVVFYRDDFDLIRFE